MVGIVNSTALRPPQVSAAYLVQPSLQPLMLMPMQNRACRASRRPSHYQQPSSQHPTQSELLVPYGQPGELLRAGIVARTALFALRAPSCGLPASCICRTQDNTSEHVSTASTSTSISQDIDVSLPPAAESPSHLVRSASFEAQQTGRSRVLSLLTHLSS